MPSREFNITIGPDGSVELQVEGCEGRSCLEAMKIFERVVGELKPRREADPCEPADYVPFGTDQGGGG